MNPNRGALYTYQAARDMHMKSVAADARRSGLDAATLASAAFGLPGMLRVFVVLRFRVSV